MPIRQIPLKLSYRTGRGDMVKDFLCSMSEIIIRA